MRYLAVPLGYQFLGISPSHLAARDGGDAPAQTPREVWPLVRSRCIQRARPPDWIVVKLRVPGGALGPGRSSAFIGVRLVLTPTLPVTISGKTLPATGDVKEVYTFHDLAADRPGSYGIPAVTRTSWWCCSTCRRGRTDPVMAGDMIDMSSHKGLAAGQTVAIFRIRRGAPAPRQPSCTRPATTTGRMSKGAFVMAV